jgi:hypothetical protein
VIQQEIWRPKLGFKDKSKFVEVISLNGQNILLALKENVVHRRSKPEGPSTDPTLIGLDFPLTTLVGIAG